MTNRILDEVRADKWATRLGIVVTLSGFIWYASARSSSLDEVRRELTEVKRVANDARDKASEVAGDVRMIRALMEREYGKLKP